MDDMVLKVIIAVSAYAGFILFVGRLLSGKWHPDGNPNRYEP